MIKVDACGVCFHDIVTRNGTLKSGVQMPVHSRPRDLRHRRRRRPRRARLQGGRPRRDRAALPHLRRVPAICRSGRETLCPDRQVHRRCRPGRRLRASTSRSRTTTSRSCPRASPLAGRLDRRLRDRHDPQRDARSRASSQRARARSSPARAAGSACTPCSSRGSPARLSSRRRPRRRRPTQIRDARRA